MELALKKERDHMIELHRWMKNESNHVHSKIYGKDPGKTPRKGEGLEGVTVDDVYKWKPLTEKQKAETPEFEIFKKRN